VRTQRASPMTSHHCSGPASTSGSKSRSSPAHTYSAFAIKPFAKGKVLTVIIQRQYTASRAAGPPPRTFSAHAPSAHPKPRTGCGPRNSVPTPHPCARPSDLPVVSRTRARCLLVFIGVYYLFDSKRWPVFRQRELLELTQVCTTPGLLTENFATVRTRYACFGTIFQWSDGSNSGIHLRHVTTGVKSCCGLCNFTRGGSCRLLLKIRPQWSDIYIRCLFRLTLWLFPKYVSDSFAGCFSQCFLETHINTQV
jgi:hypothetical protein